MLKRLALFVLAAAGLLAVLPAATLAAQLPDPCNSGTQDWNDGTNHTTWQMWDQEFSTSPTINGAIGYTVVRNLAPCEWSIGGYGVSEVWVANDQNVYGDIVQVGYQENTNLDRPSIGLPANSRRFAWSNGTTGQDYKVFSVPVLGDTPVVGHEYKMSVAAGTGYFNFCVTDKDGDNVAHCATQSSTWSGGNLAVWMFETEQTHDAMGNPSGDPTTRVYTQQYRLTGDSTWHLGEDECHSRGAAVIYYQCVSDAGHSIRAYSN